MTRGQDKVQPDWHKGLAILGGGLAGSEAALTAARLGLSVTLVDMKPGQRSPAHSQAYFAEHVCSNSLKSKRPDTAQGLLKEELTSLGSSLLALAHDHALPAGGSLAVDRENFSAAVTQSLKDHPGIRILEERVEDLQPWLQAYAAVIVATGPLPSGPLYQNIQEMTGGEGLHFFDAVAPIVEADSIDREKSFFASRYDKGGPDYLNCPLTQEEYLAFRQALMEADKAAIQDFDAVYFKDCLPIEVLASRGEDTMRYGPLRPVGLIDPKTGKRPYACLQLRQEDKEAAMWSLVGCQTRLTFPEQRRVFGLIPALGQAHFLRYGVMHRNSFIQAPLVLKQGFQSRMEDRLFFAGQLSGLEGYVEAIASGHMAAIQASAHALGLTGEEGAAFLPPQETMMGALAAWVTQAPAQDYQPMNANFGLLPLDQLGQKIKKKERGTIRQARSAQAMQGVLARIRHFFMGEAAHD